MKQEHKVLSIFCQLFFILKVNYSYINVYFDAILYLLDKKFTYYIFNYIIHFCLHVTYCLLL